MVQKLIRPFSSEANRRYFSARNTPAPLLSPSFPVPLPRGLVAVENQVPRAFVGVPGRDRVIGHHERKRNICFQHRWVAPTGSRGAARSRLRIYLCLQGLQECHQIRFLLFCHI
jgi:hypothetical protein